MGLPRTQSVKKKSAKKRFVLPTLFDVAWLFALSGAK